MGEEKGADYYNEHLGRMLLPLEESPWVRLYKLAGILTPRPDETIGIFDVGCGTGRYAKLLEDEGHENYYGVDFSSKRVEEAKRYVPSFNFDVGNILDDDVFEKGGEFDTVVILEVLEHIEGDRELIGKIPSGKRVILSVPNYDSAGHVRFFETIDQIIERYRFAINFAEGSRVIISNKGAPHKRIFTLTGITH